MITDNNLPQHVEYSDFGRFVVETLIAYGVEDKALRRPDVEWGHSSDGAMFTNSCSHVTAGGQLLDIDAIDPITNKRIFDAGIENGV